MVASDEYGSFLCDELGPLSVISLRRMFGKAGVFCDGVMFAMVNDNQLMVPGIDAHASPVVASRLVDELEPVGAE